jgi:hypothetical protein
MQSFEAKRLLGQPSSSAQAVTATELEAVTATELEAVTAAEPQPATATEPQAHNEMVLDLLSPDSPTLVEPLDGFWPNRISTPQERESLLQQSIIDMQKLLHSRVRCPSGQDRVWYEQVLRFMQRLHVEGTIPGSPNQPGRTELTQSVCDHVRKARNYPAAHEQYFRVRHILGHLEAKLTR